VTFSLVANQWHGIYRGSWLDIPSGPSTSTVFRGTVLETVFFCTGGSSTRRSTSVGSDSGAEPIREAHLEVLENDSEFGVESSAGTRKSGREVVTCDGRKARASF